MSYSTYSAPRRYTKSTDDTAKFNSMVHATFGCFALCMAVTSTINIVNASESVISPKRSTQFVIFSEEDDKTKPSRVDSDDDVSIDKMANEIKNRFGVNTSDLAKILQVSRPTVYKYLQGEGPTDSNLVSRMQQIYSLATEWSSITNRPISKELKRVYPRSRSLLDLITQNDIDMNLLTSRVRELASLSEKRSNRVDSDLSGGNIYTDNIQRLVTSVS